MIQQVQKEGTLPEEAIRSASSRAKNASSGESATVTCGARTANGTPCQRPPVDGKERCADHKGQRAMKTASDQTSASSAKKTNSSKGGSGGSAQTCRAETANGTPCQRPPVEGKERCADHKGQRAMKTASDRTSASAKNTTPAKTTSSKGGSGSDSSQTCRAETANGTPCQRPPVEGKARCADHKGQRAMKTASDQTSASSAKKTTSVKTTNSSKGGSGSGSSQPCRAETANGTPCQRPPVPGNARCSDHKGKRAM